MTHRPLFRTLIVCAIGPAIAAAGTYLALAQSAPVSALLLGIQGDGSYVLPNGWRLAPAGKHLKVGDMPLSVVQTPDSRYLIVSNNGLSRP